MASEPAVINLPVVFSTKTAYPLPSQKFMIPSTWKRYQLSQLVNKALSLSKPIPFDFLVRADILRTSLGEWCSDHGVGEEETLEIEYIESVLPPEKVSDFPHDDWVSSVSCSVPGQFFTASYDGRIRSFDYSQRTSSSTLVHNAPITSICHVPTSSIDTDDGSSYIFASASHDLTAQITRIGVTSPSSSSTLATSSVLTTLHLHAGPLTSIASNDAGSHLLTASWDGVIGYWDTTIPDSDEVPLDQPVGREKKKRRKMNGEDEKAPRKAPLAVLKSHTGRVTKAVFSREENRAYSCGFDSTVKIWDTELGVCVHTINASEKPFLSLSLAPHSSPSTLLATSSDRTMVLYDIRIPDSSTSISPALSTFIHSATPSCVSSSSSGTSQQAVTGAYDGIVRLWDLRSTKSALAGFKALEGDDKEKQKVLSVEWARGMVGVGGEGGFAVWKVGED